MKQTVDENYRKIINSNEKTSVKQKTEVRKRDEAKQHIQSMKNSIKQ